MRWNWEQPSWPEFTYDESRLTHFVDQFMLNSSVVLGTTNHISADDRKSLTVYLLSDEAHRTSQIEGEILQRDSIQSSIGRHFGLKPQDRRGNRAERGVSAMTYLTNETFDEELTHEVMHNWHGLLVAGSSNLDVEGDYRNHEEPMRIVSGAEGKRKVHFEAPPSHTVPAAMDRYVDWFNMSRDNMNGLYRAAVAHLYFESIHPYEDGNGRIGRALSLKALSQYLNRPSLIALSYTIDEERSMYYEALHRNSFELEVTNWMLYFCDLVLKAQQRTLDLAIFAVDQNKYFRKYEPMMNARQLKVTQRIIKEGLKGWNGGFSAKNYMSITQATRSTTTRDLQDLVAMGAYRKEGYLKSARYYLLLHQDY